MTASKAGKPHPRKEHDTSERRLKRSRSHHEKTNSCKGPRSTINSTQLNATQTRLDSTNAAASIACMVYQRRESRSVFFFMYTCDSLNEPHARVNINHGKNKKTTQHKQKKRADTARWVGRRVHEKSAPSSVLDPETFGSLSTLAHKHVNPVWMLTSPCLRPSPHFPVPQRHFGETTVCGRQTTLVTNALSKP